MRRQQHTIALDLLVSLLPSVKEVLGLIANQDKHLAVDMRRAMQSVVMNLGEADGSDRGNRRARLHTVMGSLREFRAGLKMAVAWDYVPGARAAALDDELDSVAAMTYRRLHPR